MLRMHRDGLIQLPPPQQACYNGRLRRRRTPQAEPQLPITGSVQGLSELHLRPLAKGAEAALWREYVDRYHYLGYTPLAGAQLRYLVLSGPQVLAVLGFAACAWKVAPRDRFIGWSAAQREARLPLVVNNRPLPDPAVGAGQEPRLLGARAQLPPVAGRLAQPLRLPPLLLETFVQSDRFVGTSYRAANWIHVGQTQGRGKLDVHNQHALPKKDIWLYPLRRISAAAFAPRSIFTPTSRPNIYPSTSASTYTEGACICTRNTRRRSTSY